MSCLLWHNSVPKNKDFVFSSISIYTKYGVSVSSTNMCLPHYKLYRYFYFLRYPYIHFLILQIFNFACDNVYTLIAVCQFRETAPVVEYEEALLVIEMVGE